MLNRRDRAKARDNIIELRPGQSHVSCKANIPLMTLAYGLGIVTLGVNASVAYDRGSTMKDKVLLSVLFFILEAMVFFLPSQASRLWMQRLWLNSILTWIVYLPLFAFAIYNSLGFASSNLSETSTVKAERITPAVSDAQRRLDTLATSRKDECLKRGDRCRQLEKDEQIALESLKTERDKVSATSDPQIASAAKLITWVSLGRFHPSADDFAMLRLLLLTILPQLGGLVLMVATKGASR